MLHILSIIGTRPEAIKMAPVIHALARHPGRIVSHVCVTGQHRAMLDQALALFQITPDDDLDIMRQAQSPADVAAAVLSGLEPILRRRRPDWVLVQGDTTTAMAAALAAFYQGISVGHVEAGLRTDDLRQPFPEEMHRRVAGLLADLHFVPTATARANLLREHVPAGQIILTGNPVIDALLATCARLPDQPSAALADLPPQRRVILVTAHRRENFGAPIESICRALHTIAMRYRDDVQIVYPVHPNPAISAPVRRLLDNTPGITLTPPLDYLPFVQLLKRCTLVLTDSGGIQEEAPSLGKPVLVLRNTTERPEAVAAGTVRLVGCATEAIVTATARLLDDASAYQQMARAINPYGDGHAAERIVDALLSVGAARERAA